MINHIGHQVGLITGGGVVHHIRVGIPHDGRSKDDANVDGIHLIDWFACRDEGEQVNEVVEDGGVGLW